MNLVSLQSLVTVTERLRQRGANRPPRSIKDLFYLPSERITHKNSSGAKRTSFQ